MAPDADPAVIRAAYRRLARDHHPDHVHARIAGGTGQAAGPAGEMAAINEAYRVLSDPARRVMYDRELASRTGRTTGAGDAVRASPPPAGRPAPAPYADAGPARMPWRFMAGMAAIGVAVVLVAAVFTDPPGEEPPDGILRSGSCVIIEDNGDAREVRCAGSGDLVVGQLVPIDARCPGGTQPHRDRLGLGTACVVTADGG